MELISDWKKAKYPYKMLHLSRKPNQNFGQLGVLAESLDDLPYRSSIMLLTEEDWYRLSVWAAEPGDAVYGVPLSRMP